MNSLYFITSIDTECDKMPDWSVRYPFQFRNITEGVPDLLQPLFERCRAKPTYLLSPEVIAENRSAAVFRNLGSTVELGTHLHGEYVEPFPNFATNFTEDFQSDYPRDVEKAKLANLTYMFESQFGYRPLSFRAGRFGMGPHTLPLLLDLGYKVDSSLYPLSRLVTKNGVSNFYGHPTTSYPYPANRAQGDTILEVPLTAASWLYSKLPSDVRRLLSESKYAHAFLKKIIGGDRIRTWSLRPSTYDFLNLKDIMDHHILHSNGKAVFLNMMFHSNEIIPNCSPYSRTEDDVSRILNTLRQTLRYAEDIGATFIGLSEAHQLFLKSGRLL